jgi:hypothetical protein
MNNIARNINHSACLSGIYNASRASNVPRVKRCMALVAARPPGSFCSGQCNPFMSDRNLPTHDHVAVACVSASRRGRGNAVRGRKSFKLPATVIEAAGNQREARYRNNQE